MKTRNPKLSDAAMLRQKAEAKVKNKVSESYSAMSESDILKLIQELEVHQLELEMQNQELEQAKRKVSEQASEKYEELYDFAPTGYFTISNQLKISKLNLAGAVMMGKERSRLINRRFDQFLTEDTKPVFSLFIQKVLKSNVRESCEVTLSTNDSLPMYLHLTAIVTDNGDNCLMTAANITEHKSLEALNEILLTSLPYPAMYIRKKDMVILAANKHALDLGVQPGGQCWREFMRLEYISPEDKQKVSAFPGIVPHDLNIRCTFCQADACFASTLGQNNPEVKAIGAIWDIYWIRVSSEVFLHYAINIAERKKAEEELKASELKFRQFFEANTDGIAIFPIYGDKAPEILIDLNENAAKMLGYSKEEMLQLTIDKIEKDRSPEKTEVRKQELLARSISTFETTLLHKDGREIDVEIKVMLINYKNQPTLMNIVRDITERKHAGQELLASEAKFRELFEVNSDGIVIFSIGDGNSPSVILDLNENAARMVGLTKEEYWIAEHTAFEKDITKQELKKRKNELLAKGVLNFETVVKHRDGHDINVEIKIILINFNNQPAVMNIVRDITDRVKNEIQLQKYAIELSKQIAEKDKFFSIVAHDLRSPIGNFVEMTRLLDEGIQDMEPETIRKITGALKKSSANLSVLLTNLLEWSRMQRGLIKFEPTSLFLMPLISDDLVLVNEAAAKKEITIQYNVSENMVVSADRNMLSGIMRNLLSNAVKFTPHGGLIIVSARPIAEGRVEISIKDNGIGMSADFITNLFHLDANTSRRGTDGEPSSGLGLIICKDFIEKHNGRFWVESEPDNGTTVYFTLPFGDHNKAKNINVNDIQHGKYGGQVKKLKILIAEDDETSDILLTLALKKYCNDFLHANTGVKAVESVAENPDIDVVLMDVKMPEMDGYEAVRQIRMFNSDIIIIAQTAYVNENEYEKAIEAGCTSYISKPIHLAELISLVENCLKNRK